MKKAHFAKPPAVLGGRPVVGNRKLIQDALIHQEKSGYLEDSFLEHCANMFEDERLMTHSNDTIDSLQNISSSHDSYFILL